MRKFVGVLDKFKRISNYIPLSANSSSRPVKNNYDQTFVFTKFAFLN